MATKEQNNSSAKPKVSEFFQEFLKQNPKEEKPLRQLFDLHSSQLDIAHRHQLEILELEKKYHRQYVDLYAKRTAVVNGAATEDGGKRDSVHSSDAKASSRGLPGFWLRAMRNNPLISRDITKDDEAALAKLKDVRIEYLRRPGFRLQFDFDENDFFTNTTLKKSFTYQRDADDFTGELAYGDAKGDKIRWKRGKNLTEKTAEEDGETVSISVESFFDFFDTPSKEDAEAKRAAKLNGSRPADSETTTNGNQKENDAQNGNDDDDSSSDAGSALEWALEHDFDMGEEFKEKLIPHALYWYTGEAALYESDDESEDGECVVGELREEGEIDDGKEERGGESG
ncbi:hypothetical protein BDY21DRAFT_373535 [Lineolata rhizophorae]|uniref:Nucleosome assembly protein n=1 Tax=Lineolata rhizophorae TaxID=578093 RepID=A0A6A6NTY8_9PEZI|nr:hypothetical protein BDY21DRAFT_373535 [Lineolata rhizophorae]